jgi:hypothetical protein
MKIKLPSPDTMDKIVLGVAVAGIAVIFLTLRNVPTPEEYHADVKDYLNTMLVLQNKANEAISNKDYFTACLNQQQVVNLALQHNVSDLGIDVDNILRLEELVCGTELKETI